MVTLTFLSNEFVEIGSAGTDNLRAKVPTTCGPNMVHVATGGKKWLKKLKSERNDIELVYFSLLDSSRLADNFGVVERQKQIKITKLWLPKDGQKVASRLILSQ